MPSLNYLMSINTRSGFGIIHQASNIYVGLGLNMEQACVITHEMVQLSHVIMWYNMIAYGVQNNIDVGTTWMKIGTHNKIADVFHGRTKLKKYELWVEKRLLIKQSPVTYTIILKRMEVLQTVQYVLVVNPWSCCGNVQASKHLILWFHD